jgi:hypothetical protein
MPSHQVYEARWGWQWSANGCRWHPFRHPVELPCDLPVGRNAADWRRPPRGRGRYTRPVETSYCSGTFTWQALIRSISGLRDRGGSLHWLSLIRSASIAMPCRMASETTFPTD